MWVLLLRRRWRRRATRAPCERVVEQCGEAFGRRRRTREEPLAHGLNLDGDDRRVRVGAVVEEGGIGCRTDADAVDEDDGLAGRSIPGLRLGGGGGGAVEVGQLHLTPPLVAHLRHHAVSVREPHHCVAQCIVGQRPGAPPQRIHLAAHRAHAGSGRVRVCGGGEPQLGLGFVPLELRARRLLELGHQLPELGILCRAQLLA